MKVSPFFLQFIIFLARFIFLFSTGRGKKYLRCLSRKRITCTSPLKKTSSLCVFCLNGKQKKRSTSTPLISPSKPTQHYFPYSFNLEFVICSLPLLKKHGIFSFCVERNPPCPRPLYFLTRIVNA